MWYSSGFPLLTNWAPELRRQRRSRTLHLCAIVALAVFSRTDQPAVTSADAAPHQAAGAPALPLLAQPRLRAIHVDVHDPTASDRNMGTAPSPLQTIGRAVQIALADNADGMSVTIFIHPGMYREAISIPADGTNASLALQATEKGKSVVSGSDVWKGWRPWGNRGIFTHPWVFSWGLAPVPQGWPRLHDIVRRREMIFVNGLLLNQVVGLENMSPGTFSVDEGAHLVYIWPRDTVDPNTAMVEVAVRDPLLLASGRTNLTIRGLVFQHAATALDASAVTVNNSTHVLIEDSTFLWNNWGGLAMNMSVNAVVRRSGANHNGARGMSTWKAKNVLFEDNETSYNNWRGSWGDFFSWATAGIKNMFVHKGTFRRHRSIGNETWGFWLDTDNQNVTIEDGVWCNNNAGAFVEASQGPITIARAIICINNSTSLGTSISQNVTLQNSIIYNTAPYPLFEINDLPSGVVQNWETGQEMMLRTQQWTLCGNVFISTGRSQYLFSVPDWNFFLNTLRSSRNDYWNPHTRAAFWLRASPRTGRALDLSGWQALLGQDSDSIFADPRFADPGKGDFQPLLSSPWRKC